MQYWFCQSTKMWHRGNCRFHHPTQNFKLTPKLEFTAINLQFMNFVEMFCQSETYRLQNGRYAVTRRYSCGACCRSSSLSKWDERKVISRALKTRRSFSYHSAFLVTASVLTYFAFGFSAFPSAAANCPLAAQDAGTHCHTLFGEGHGHIPGVASVWDPKLGFQTHNLLIWFIPFPLNGYSKSLSY